MLNLTDALFIGMLFRVLMLSIAGGDGLVIGGGTGIKIRTSKKARLWRPSQNPLAAISNLAPSSVMAEAPERGSPVTGCRVGSMQTS